MVEHRWTQQEIEDFERRYAEDVAFRRRMARRKREENPSLVDIPVRIVEMDLDFPSISACARFLRVSKMTVSRMLESGEKCGDLTIIRRTL